MRGHPGPASFQLVESESPQVSLGTELGGLNRCLQHWVVESNTAVRRTSPLGSCRLEFCGTDVEGESNGLGVRGRPLREVRSFTELLAYGTGHAPVRGTLSSRASIGGDDSLAGRQGELYVRVRGLVVTGRKRRGSSNVGEDAGGVSSIHSVGVDGGTSKELLKALRVQVLIMV